MFLCFLVCGATLLPGVANVIAHTNNSWLTVNGQKATENANPVSLKLLGSDHIIEKNFTRTEVLNFDLNTDLLFGEGAAVDIAWEFKLAASGEQIVTDNGNKISRTFDREGMYLGLITLTERGGQGRKTIEDIFFTVGEAPGFSQPNVQVVESGQVINKNDVGVYQVSRTKQYKLKIESPQSNYDYSWDVGADEVLSGSEIAANFSSTKLPRFIFLRSKLKDSNFFIDTPVRIDSPEPPLYAVAQPADNPNEKLPDSYALPINALVETRQLSTFVLLAGVVALFLLLASAVLLARMQRQRGKIGKISQL